MEVGGLPPDPEPPARASVLRDSGRARLTRLFLPGRTVIRKEPLAEAAAPLDLDELIRLAVSLTRAVGGMHRRGVKHGDITPANVVISDDGAPCLVDFASATSFAELRPEFTHHTQIAGTLAYLAPEQTGRTGRAVDHRADLYALGTVVRG